MPFQPDTGIAHCSAWAATLRPLDDARRAGSVSLPSAWRSPSADPRTVDECLADQKGLGTIRFGRPASPGTLGTGWDFEDVRDDYVHHLYGGTLLAVRYSDPARYLDLGRAAVAACMSSVFSEWRRGGSSCSGGIVLSWRDLRPGTGWGLVDARGR